MEIRYGTNPHQRASVELVGERSPIEIRSGAPSYINLLDALNAWPLVRAARAALGTPVAASFKHVSPAGVATAGALDEVTAAATGARDALSPVASAYARARDVDPKCSFGDFVAVSEPVDVSLAQLLAGVVSDGVIAPGFEEGAMGILEKKKGGSYLVVEVDPSFSPPAEEARDLFGLRLIQDVDDLEITTETLGAAGAALPGLVQADLVLGLLALRYTQSNSVGFVRQGLTLGIGAGQQSRVDCTKLAGGKVDTWWLRRHPEIQGMQFAEGVRRQDRINWQIRVAEGDLTEAEQRLVADVIVGPVFELGEDERHGWLAQLDGVSMVSDGFIPFRDNIDQAARHGVQYLAEPGGAARSADIEEACREADIAYVTTGVRLFHH